MSDTKQRMTASEYLARHEALLKKHGNLRKVSAAVKIPESTLRSWVLDPDKHLYTQRSPKQAEVVPVPKRSVRRFVLTSAQDRTRVHEGFLENLRAYCGHTGAELRIGGFTYNKSLFEENRPSKLVQDFPDSIVPYMDYRQVQLGDNLVWCAEMNTLPTAVTPLTGFETYTGSRWGIFPHAKVQLESVATMKGTPAKQLLTTGSVTYPNYVQRRAGIRAHKHHAIGAVVVEIDSAGRHFCRHVLAEEDGAFQDLDLYAKGGKVTSGHTVEGITWGDIHVERIDERVAAACWGDPENDSLEAMVDVLRPSYQFFHDSLDFYYRNHHNTWDPHHMFEMWARGTESIHHSTVRVGDFLAYSARPFAQSVVVASNHDLAFERWLKEADWRRDPVNAELYLEANLAMIRSIKSNEERPFSALEWAVRRDRPALAERIAFLREDESFVICGDIECGMHGHRGANGAKGAIGQFTKAGPKVNIGDKHCPAIRDGVFVAGVSGQLDMRYNKGLSGWAHAHILTYRNGKRAIVTMQDGRWRA